VLPRSGRSERRVRVVVSDRHDEFRRTGNIELRAALQRVDAPVTHDEKG